MSSRKLTFNFLVAKRWQTFTFLIVYILTRTSYSKEKQRFKKGPRNELQIASTVKHTLNEEKKNVCCTVRLLNLCILYSNKQILGNFYIPQKGLQMSRNECMKKRINQNLP